MKCKIKKSSAIMSYLSDVQEMVSFGKISVRKFSLESLKDESLTKFVDLRINFVKLLILDERTEMTESELNKLWKIVIERYG